MIAYTVKVWPNGSKEWYLNDKQYTEQEFNEKMNPCANKIIEIDGKKYILTSV